jgi:hypothetical protein
VDEAGYWASLEYRICREFDGMPDRRLRSLWCDGFIPAQYLFSEPNWICNGPSQDEWDFTLFLPQHVRSRVAIPWASLLPAEDVTRWLALDLRGRRIQIEPMAAVRDFG